MAYRATVDFCRKVEYAPKSDLDLLEAYIDFILSPDLASSNFWNLAAFGACVDELCARDKKGSGWLDRVSEMYVKKYGGVAEVEA